MIVETTIPTGAGSEVPLVELSRLSMSFQEGRQQRQVLTGIDMTFYRGQFVVLLGKSGSGKSTLLNLISGIDTPTAGTVRIDDTVITELRERERTLYRRDHIGFIFQFFNLIPTLTVLENVTLPLELAGHKRAAVEPRALALLERVQLADRRNSAPDRLSGGEQQRVAIARALVHNPMLVLADEPTGNLDEETGRIVMELLLELTEEQGKTLIMATHNPEITPLADRVFRLSGGELIETAQSDRLSTTPPLNPPRRGGDQISPPLGGTKGGYSWLQQTWGTPSHDQWPLPLRWLPILPALPRG